MEYAQILVDTGISANWVMALLLGVVIILQKRANDKADQREKKVDSILEDLTHIVNNHDKTLAIHDIQLKSGVQVHITKADA